MESLGLFFLLSIPAVLIIGISKGGFGGGLGVIAVPMMSLIMSPAEAAGVLLPILCFMDLLSLWKYRGHMHWPNLVILLPAAVLGIVIGTFTFRYLDEHHLKLLIGILALLFVLNQWLRPAQKIHRVSKPLGWGMGALAGFTSFIAHAGGPPVNMYLLPQRLDRTLFVGTTVIFFTVVNYVKLIPYYWLGQLSNTNLTLSLLLVPAAVVGVWMGIWLHQRLNDRLFYQICYSLLAVLSLKLIWDGVTG